MGKLYFEAVILFEKTGIGGTDQVWFYDMTADGLSLDDKRQPIDDNDIPDIIKRFGELDNELERKRTEKSFMVPKDEIKENGYDLSINRYKEIVYEEVAYDPPGVILERVAELEEEFMRGVDELRGMVL
jgi:type I restriction enzyme M protein